MRTHCGFRKTNYARCPRAHGAGPEQMHTCLEGQAGVAAVEASEGSAHELHDVVELGLDVLEGDFGQGVAVLVNEHGT